MFLAIFLRRRDCGESIMKRTVKKTSILAIFFCLAVMMLAGCKKEEKKEEKVQTHEFFYDKLPKSDQKVSEEENKKIKNGIENWAKSVLMVDSSVGKKNRETIEKSFYQSIVDEKQREKVKKDRKKFYKDSEVSVQSTEAVIEEAYATEYGGRQIGDIACKVIIKGERNGKAFSRTYHLKLAVSYEREVVSVYEIGDITWK